MLSLLAIAITSKLAIVCEAKVEFDVDFPKYGVKKGVHVKEEEREVYAPVAMWLEALDLILERLKGNGLQFGSVKGVSGAGQQHGSVYWSQKAESMLRTLDPSKTLIEQLAPDAFSHPWSPNWQDASTQGECDEFDECLGGEEELAKVTGSKAHHVSLQIILAIFNAHQRVTSASRARRSSASTRNIPKFTREPLG
jgi:xylulokinase